MYELHFLDRDPVDGAEHNGGEPMGVETIEEAAEECGERGSRGQLFDGDRMVAEIDAAGLWRWL